MSSKPRYYFQNRWVVEGELRSLSPFHIGDGSPLELPDLHLLNEEGKPAKIAALARDSNRRPFIPGSTLKGCIRSWLESNLKDSGILRTAFGNPFRDSKKNPLGGRFEFLDALVPDGVQVATSVVAQVAIDRRSRTAAHRKLFHVDAVQPGARLRVKITAQNVSEQEIALLLVALDAFSDATNPIQMGASTADGWGRFSWQLTSLQRLLPEQIQAHMKTGKLGYEDLPALPLAVLDQHKANARSLLHRRARLEIPIKLEFDGAFLVNDPAQCKTPDHPKEADLPNHAPLLDSRGQAYLPASGFRGVLRSQAERILRTLGHNVPEPPNVSTMHEVRALDRASLLFGAPGWKSPVSISDFRMPSTEQRRVKIQQFIAIDRFTGGGADHKKFDAKYVLNPVLEGVLTIDLDRLASAQPGGWAFALLAHLLRDLREGDLTFGFGSSKGYGACKARVGPIHIHNLDHWPAVYRPPEFQENVLRDLLERGTLPENSPTAIQWFRSLQEAAHV
ncbi:MAG: hypothetical protein IPJ98_31120 [Bryobacterales bacterium]|nr:hypothetical protein [Bryobacterales bacterium]